MLGRPASKEAVKLFHEGAKALSQVEENGIRIDVEYLDKKILQTERKIQEIEEELKLDPIYKRWYKRFGSKTKLGNRGQLAEIVFGEMGYECKNWTEGRADKYGKRTKRPKADEQSLKDTGLPFIDKYIHRSKLLTAKNNWLMDIKRELCGDRIHPFFNLAGGATEDKGDPRTYRSSAADPQVHNFPKRDEEQSKLVRRTIIPEDNWVLIEADFKGIEVSVSYCYHKDPTMRDYLLTKGADMHRDVAIQAFFLDKEPHTPEWWKDEDKLGGYHARYTAKNKFTFPQFYGDYWLNCARNIWEDIARRKMHTPSGVPMYEHLKKHGIKRLGDQDPKAEPKKGTYEFYIKEVQYDFWKRRFKVYDKWRQDWYEQFTKRGWFRMKTGFVCTGTYTRNQVINYPVQGAAFHCLLWCLIRLQKWLNQNKMKTKIVSEIHDSLILYSPKNEVHKVVAKMQEIMRKDLLEAWDWIIIPLGVDISVSETNWSECIPYEKFYGVAA